MALTVRTFTGFETGGLEESSSVSGSPDATEATIVRSGIRSLKMAGAATAAVYKMSATGANRKFYGFGVHFTDITPASDIDFIEIEVGANTILIRIKATSGDIELIDADGDSVGTASAPLTVNTWHFMEMFTADSVSGDINLFIDTVEKITGATASTQNATNITLRGSTTVGEDIYFDDIYALNGDASEDKTNLLGDAEVFMYQNTAEDATDQGDTLADGTWALVSEVPLNEGTANDAQYQDDTGPNLTGSTICDEGTRSGPSGDVNIDGDSNIKAAKFIGRFKRGTGGGRTFGFLHGNSGDGVTSGAITLTTAYATKTIASEAASIVPLSTESFQHGFSKSATAGQDIFCGDIWAMLLHVPSAVAADPSTDAESFIAGQQQPVIEQTEIVGY